MVHRADVTLGGYAITGKPAQTRATYLLAATPAAFAVHGFAADTQRAFYLSVTAASYSINGSPADLTYSGGFTVVDGALIPLLVRRRRR